ncbi:MAG TPA: type II toxin-antitoxin system VapC family toxin [Segetibacter sp.]|jgi:predicted nucleic acid-binding protein
MSTTNKIFLDSSVLVEALKGNKANFFKNVISNRNNNCCINETVLSEYLFFIIGFNGGASPRTLKEKTAIPQILINSQNVTSVLTDFSFLTTSSSLLNIVPHLMQKYNLLPNDAIILATCKIHNITKLASHDSDFVAPCSAEGIELLSEEF